MPERLVRVDLIANRLPYAAATGMVHVPVAVHGLPATVDADITLCRAEARWLVEKLTQVLGEQGERERE
ncbi:hypothetical protein RM780_19220 [Streptomyces sp. DSM 44917]|uniref:Uncharacterized protein n=1 Tax=Streptomyces boetiae TaxID=3075541 RepID=A0ABU2LC45_9ACTN|nr:hypothetical protein [Streptomyces sp. DSM 44917]MDT0309075.1 hypothetical protein [Streptomyces sp. DSM 44917]